ncbi:MAG: hypothetical protein RL754_152 [Bacteroidota bacterium]|jgi:hypothetical protein
MSTPAEMWNERYSKPAYAYGKEPNEFFKEELGKLVPGGMLFPAAGEGRNAVHAIELGWNVIAFDQSFAAKEKAIALAEEKGLTIEYAVANASEYMCPVLVDAISYSFFHVPAADRKNLYKRLNGFLTLNGHVIFEGFSIKNLDLNSGGPKVPSMLFTEEMVRELFADFRSIEVWEERTTLNHGLYHNGEAVVIRARGRK